MKIWKEYKYLIALLLAGALFRLPLVFDGLPAVYNSTEFFLAKISLNMGARVSLDPLIYIYPTLYSYLLLGLYAVYYVFGYISGVFSGTAEFAVRFLTDPAWFYLVGRLFSLLLSLLTVIVIYAGIRKLYDEKSARIAGLMTVLCISFTRFSAWATADSLLILFSALATIQILALERDSGFKNYFFLGVLYGLAVAAKYNAGFIIIGAIIILARQKNNRTRAFLWLTGGAVFAFSFSNPYWILKPEAFLTGFRLISDQMYTAVSFDRGINYLWEIGTLVKTELTLGILMLIAVPAAIRSGLRQHLPLLAIIFSTFLYVGTWHKKGLDYLFPVFPALIILAVIYFRRLETKLLSSRIKVQLFYGLVFAPSLIMIVYLNLTALASDTRETATEWITEHIPNDQIICYDSDHYDLGIYDIDRFTSYGAGAKHLPAAVKERLEMYRGKPANKRMTPIVYFDSLTQSHSSNLYLAEQQVVRRKTLQMLRDEGVSFVITRSDLVDLYRDISDEDLPEILAEKVKQIRLLHNELNQNYRPVYEASPSLFTPGPHIKIYNIGRNNGIRN